MSKEIFAEKQDIGLGLGLVIFLVFVVVFALVLLSLSRTDDPIWVAPFLIVLLGALVFIFFNFHRLLIIVSDRFLILRFGLFCKKIRRSEITKAEPHTLHFREFGGYGWRLGLTTGDTALNTRNGPGVRIILKGKKRGIVFSTDNPEKVCRLLKKKVR